MSGLIRGTDSSGGDQATPPVGERYAIIAAYCSGLKVLDVGSGDHRAENIEGATWLHGLLCDVAKRVVGVELVPELAQRMRELGYNVIQGNLETFDAEEQFDVVVAGEVIEHVDNQLAALLNLRRHLSDGGRLVITTPNSLGWRYAGSVLLVGMFMPNPEHTLWHDEHTLGEIVRRAGFEPERIYYTTIRPSPSDRWGRLCYVVDKILMSFRPRLAPQMVMVCRPRGRPIRRDAGEQSTPS